MLFFTLESICYLFFIFKALGSFLVNLSIVGFYVIFIHHHPHLYTINYSLHEMHHVESLLCSQSLQDF